MAFRFADDHAVYPDIKTYIAKRVGEFDQIAPDRKTKLASIAELVARKASSGDTAKITFICTHNSRRSHMVQIWAQTAAWYYGIPNVETFSGGAEATAFNPRAVAAMERVGFRIEKASESDNPVYHVRSAADAPFVEAYSKVFTSSPPNPRSEFTAVMTCSQADEACPYVRGAELRVSIPYGDPKAFDGTDEEAQKYDERCRQISREMLYMLSLVKPKASQ